MFTGLVQALGQLQHLGSDQLKVTCSAPPILQDLALGDSIAVDGVCLTVETILAQGFIASASPETLKCSTLGKVLDQGIVNLEASLRVGSKIGGHFVTGHVDGIGQLEAASRTENTWEISFTANSSVARYIVSKGSIAVNGISLTVADCSAAGDWFKAAVIPVTYADTNLQYLQPGDWVNLEGDVLGKYVEKFVRLGPDSAQNGSTPITNVSMGFLAEHGYL